MRPSYMRLQWRLLSKLYCRKCSLILIYRNYICSIVDYVYSVANTRWTLYSW